MHPGPPSITLLFSWWSFLFLWVLADAATMHMPGVLVQVGLLGGADSVSSSSTNEIIAGVILFLEALPPLRPHSLVFPWLASLLSHTHTHTLSYVRASTKTLALYYMESPVPCQVSLKHST